MSDKQQRKEYYCPECEKGFNEPLKYVFACCGVETDEVDKNLQLEKCRQCGQVKNSEELIPVCPLCGNDNNAAHWDCWGSYRREIDNG